MTGTILERLNARVAAEPALINLDSLLGDLKDARDTIVAAVDENTNLKDILSTPPAQPSQPIGPTDLDGARQLLAVIDERRDDLLAHFPELAPAAPAASAPAAQQSESLVEALTFLRNAKDRLAVNSPATAGDNIDSAIKLLTPEKPPQED